MSWPLIPVSQLCDFAIDCVNKTAPTVDYITPYKMIRTTNVKSGYIDFENVKYVTKDVFLKWTRRSRPQYGDVILTREAPVGEVGRFISRDENFFLGQRLFHYRPNRLKLDWNFLTYLLMSPLVNGKLKNMGFGATVEHIRVGDAENLLIPCPPLPIQKKIGYILSTYDDLIENNRRRMRLLEESARLLYKEWFVHLRFPGHERCKIVDGVPEGWEEKTLGDICYDVRNSVSPDKISFDTPYIGLEHMPRRSISLSEWGFASDVNSTKLSFTEGDFLFGKIRPYFHKVGIAFVNGITSSDSIVIRPYEESLYALTIMTISSDIFIATTSQQVKEGSKMPRADWKQMKKFQVLLPKSDILSKFNEYTSPIFSQLRLLCFENKNLAAARDLLLPRLMSGEVAV